MSEVAHGDGRQALIEAAVQVIGEFGWGGLTNRRVAAVAGVDNTLITHHFGGREALIAAAADWATAASIESTRITVEGSSGESFAELFLRLVESEPTMQAFQLELVLAARRDAQLRPVVSRLIGNYVESMSDMLSAAYALPPDPDLARVVFAALEGLVLQLLTVTPSTTVRRSLQSLDTLLEAFASSQPTDRRLEAAPPA